MSTILDEKNLQHKTNENEIDLISQNYFRNLDLLVDYEILLDSYCDISDSWETKQFADDNHTLRDIHRRIEQIISDEYNKEYCNMVQLKNYINENLKSIILNLEKQYSKYKTQKDIIQNLEKDFIKYFKLKLVQIIINSKIISINLRCQLVI